MAQKKAWMAGSSALLILSGTIAAVNVSAANAASTEETWSGTIHSTLPQVSAPTPLAAAPSTAGQGTPAIPAELNSPQALWPRTVSMEPAPQGTKTVFTSFEKDEELGGGTGDGYFLYPNGDRYEFTDALVWGPPRAELGPVDGDPLPKDGVGDVASQYPEGTILVTVTPDDAINSLKGGESVKQFVQFPDNSRVASEMILGDLTPQEG
jgi:hypothetical protein